MMQSMIVALIVLGCSGYVVWTLMPAAARRSAAIALLRLPLPARLTVRLRKAAQASSGCGCSGCDRAATKPVPGTTRSITFHPRTRR